MLELPKVSHSPLGLVTLVPPFNYDAGTQIISGETLIHTENAVFTHEGRYFVAGEHADPDLGWGNLRGRENGLRPWTGTGLPREA